VYGRRPYRGSSSFGFGGDALTPMVKRLLIANVVVFAVQVLLGRSAYDFERTFTVSVEGVMRGMVWQPFTYMWLHGNALHLLMNMFGLWMFGTQLETLWGSRRFLRFYLYCGTGAGVIILLWHSLLGQPYTVTLGASGAIYGILMAFSLTWPDRTIMLLFPPIPIKAIWFVPFLFLMQISMGGDQAVSHAGHLGGAITALALMREEFTRYANLRSLRYRWHRWRMRNRLRAVRRDEWDRRQKREDDDRPTYH
jgi:membrane associated rhomboid family serine protease